MMLPTHVLAGLLLALPLVVLDPSLAPAALAGAVAGSVLPDLDLYAGHRRTLHYPTGYVLLAGVLGLLALIRPAPILVGIAVAALGAALHCRMDRYGGGLELRPWEGRSERAVYDHVRGEWRVPRRWIAYDGAPADLALASLLAAPSLVAFDGTPRLLATAALAVGIVYATLRRYLADVAPRAVGVIPEPYDGYVPERYREG